MTVLIACTVGYVGYFAFGNSAKSVIIYNLPDHDPASIITKIFYIITICGSFVLVINPVFHVIESSNFYNGRCSDPPKDDVPEETPSQRPDEGTQREAQP